MEKSRILPVQTIVAALMLVWPSMAKAQTASPQDTLNQYVSDLQRNPSDTALRENIIKLAQEMNPPPAVSEEARRHYVMAKTLFDGAKKPDDFGDSISEFKAALLAASWWPEANRDLGLALEAAQRFDDAIAYVKLYMATNPGDERLRAAQDELYKIEAKKRLAAKAAQDAQLAAAEEARVKAEQQRLAYESSSEGKFETLLRKIDGRRYTCYDFAGVYPIIDVRGAEFVFGVIDNRNGNHSYIENQREPIQGRESRHRISRFDVVDGIHPVGETVTFSEDGDRITLRTLQSNGATSDEIYLWNK
jgi:hypothetical protein